MMEYSIDEALSLLTKNLASAKKTLTQVQEDLDFIRDQTTTTEVSILNNAHHSRLISIYCIVVNTGRRTMAKFSCSNLRCFIGGYLPVLNQTTEFANVFHYTLYHISRNINGDFNLAIT